MAGSHPVEVGEEHALGVLGAATEFVDHLVRRRAWSSAVVAVRETRPPSVLYVFEIRQFSGALNGTGS